MDRAQVYLRGCVYTGAHVHTLTYMHKSMNKQRPGRFRLVASPTGGVRSPQLQRGRGRD